jgi:hypothetical protein
LAFGLEDVPHLVDEEEYDEPDPELPPPEERVGRDRDEHRRRGGDDLELPHREEDRLELGEEPDEQGDRHPQLAQQPKARLVPDRFRLLVAVVDERLPLLGR